MRKFKIIAISAVSLDGIIGIGSQIPWHIPEDFKHFRETTMNNIVVVGYNTYLTLPEKAFEKRIYIVLNDGERFEITKQNVYQFDNFEDALSLIKVLTKFTDKNVYIAGGEMIYKSLLDYCDEAIITWVNKIYPNGTKTFPIENLFSNFDLCEDSDWIKSKNELQYKITKYKKSDYE